MYKAFCNNCGAETIFGDSVPIYLSNGDSHIKLTIIIDSQDEDLAGQLIHLCKDCLISCLSQLTECEKMSEPIDYKDRKEDKQDTSTESSIIDFDTHKYKHNKEDKT